MWIRSPMQLCKASIFDHSRRYSDATLMGATSSLITRRTWILWREVHPGRWILFPILTNCSDSNYLLVVQMHSSSLPLSVIQLAC